jgi:hypothetical protein
MFIYLTAHSPQNGEAYAMSRECRDWIKSSNTEKVIIFVPDGKDYTQFIEETKLCLDDACQLETVMLRPLTSNFESPSEIQDLPWQNLNTITSHMNATAPKTMFIGRGPAIHDHIMWLASKCRNGVKTIHFDDVNVTETEAIPPSIDENKKGFATIAGLLQNHVEDILRKRTENVGWSHAHRLGGQPGGAIESGVRKALSPSIDLEMVEFQEVDSGKTVSYKIAPIGIETAILAYSKARELSEEPQREVLISFARLPRIQRKNEEERIMPFSFFNLIAPLQPVDGLICVLQHHDSSIEGTHIMTLSQACEDFEDSSIIGNLRHVQQSLEHRCTEYSILFKDHVVIINPKPNSTTTLQFTTQLLAALSEFENLHGGHRLRIDMTGPLTQIRTAASMLGLNLHARMTYTIKPNSKHSRRHYSLNLPGMEAYEAFQQVTKVNKNNQYDVKMLKVLMAYESQTVEAVADEFDFFGDVVGKQDPPTLPELQTFANNHIENDEDKIPKQQGNRVIKRLRSRGLVAVTILPDKAKTRYELTDIGHFVATQLMHLDKGATTL